jgi:hypothetical protein
MLCRSLEFAQRPDYDAYRALLEKMRDRKVSGTTHVYWVPSIKPALHSVGHLHFMGMFVHMLICWPS